TRIGNASAPDRALLQQQVQAQLRQPSIFGGRTTGFLSSHFSVYPLLFADSTADEGVIGFSEVRASTGLERPFFGHRVFVSGAYNWQLALPLDYRSLTLGRKIAALDELLVDLVIAYPELNLTWDLRDDPIATTSGALLSMNLQATGAIFGSDVDDLRLRPEARFYRSEERRVGKE